MKADNIKKTIGIKLLKNGIVIAVLALLVAGAYVYNTMNEDELLKLRGEIRQVEGQVAKKRQEYQDSEQQLKEYLSIPQTRLPTQSGYATARERLQVSIPEVQGLKDAYAFKKLNFSLGEIKRAREALPANYTAFEGEITVTLGGASDEFVYSFLNDLKHVLPGYLYIKNMRTVRQNDINNATVTSYLTQDNYELVSTDLKLGWITVKTEGNSQQPAVAVPDRRGRR